VTIQLGELGSEMIGQQIVIAGMVQRLRRHLTKNGNEMAFVTLEDQVGTCDIVVFPRVWESSKHLWESERALVVGGKVDAGRRNDTNVLCTWVKSADQVLVPTDANQSRASPYPPDPPSPPPPPTRTIRVTVKRSGEQARDVRNLRTVHGTLAKHSGQDRFTILLVSGDGNAIELEFPNRTTGYCPELVQELAAVLGQDAVDLVSGVGARM
jgi:DNA polymerase-3 subunit alpha